MTNEQQATLDAANASIDSIAGYLADNPAAIDSDAWKKQQTLVDTQNKLQDQINDILALQFPKPSAALTDAVTQLQTAQNDLDDVLKNLATIAKIVDVADAVVQAVTAVITQVPL